MFLDPLNFLHLPGIGILCYFAHRNSIYFYEEKAKTKNFEFNASTVEFVENNTKLKFVPFSVPKGILSKFKSIKNREVDELYLQSIYSPKEFKEYFMAERITNLPPNTVDYMIMFKNSKKLWHNSDVENRIIRIDWYKKLIQYYGGQEDSHKAVDEAIDEGWEDVKDSFAGSFAGGAKKTKEVQQPVVKQPEEVYGAKIPIPNFKININDVNDENIKDLATNILKYKKEQDVKSKKSASAASAAAPEPEPTSVLELVVVEFIKRVKINNGINEIKVEPTDLKSYLIKIRLCLNDETYNPFDKLLDCLDSSILKSNWRKYCEDYGLLTMLQKLLIHSKDLKRKEFDIIASKHLKLNENDGTDAYFEYIIRENKSAMDTSKIENVIYVRIGDDLIPVKIDDEPTDESTDMKCGAGNCYRIITHDDKKYGVRFNKNIYYGDSLEFYNAVRELTLNSVLAFLLKAGISSGSITSKFANNIAMLQDIISVGFYTVKIMDANGDIKDGYIPYIITEYNPSLITLDRYILNHINSENPWTPEKLKSFLCNVMVQIYNFEILAYTKFNFKHEDFKINNILINEETMQLFIIDFEHSSMNFQYNGRNYYLAPRNKLYDIIESKKDNILGEKYESYNWYVSNIIKNKIFSDADMFTFLWRMYYPEGSKIPLEHNNNYTNYYTVLNKFMQNFTTVGEKFTKPPQLNPRSVLFKLINEKKIMAANPLVLRLREILNAIIDLKCDTPALRLKCDDVDYSEFEADKKLIKDNNLMFKATEPREPQAGGNGKLHTRIRILRNKNKRRSTIAKRKTLKRYVNKTNHKTNHKSRKTSRYH